MRTEEILVMFGLIFMSYWLGYVIGFHRCADYIKSLIFDGGGKNETDRGTDEHV